MCIRDSFADRVMEMNADGVTVYLGNFDDYVEKRDRPQPPAPVAVSYTHLDVYKRQYVDSAKLIDHLNAYDPAEACELACKTSKAKLG